MSSQTEHEQESGIATASKQEVKRPRRYLVIMHNDDYTTMEFVIHVLEKFFNHHPDQAYRIMLEVHHKGRATCGIFTYEVAESKVAKVIKYARDNDHPLKCTLEPEE
ncbi:MAG TPA: ATP-dependent Clp protease adapter ClpS [Bacteriovoracaceae bacterium]|nr:ATP-dependent Clp protease adapter ClpS [Bacteriovoracaceae bacterium]